MSENTVAMPSSSETSEPSGRHPVNVGHLVMGVAFLGLTLVWALIASDAVEGADIRWLLPIPWVAAGIAGVLASVIPSGHRRGQSQTGWVTPPQDTSSDSSPETTEETMHETTDETTDETNEEDR